MLFTVVNVAKNNPAMQSSVGWGGEPSRAVDGNVYVFQNTYHNNYHL